VTGTAFARYRSGRLSAGRGFFMTANTVLMVQGHIGLCGAILNAHVLENVAALLAEVTTAAFFFGGDAFGVSIVQELHCGHPICPWFRRKIDHQNVRSLNVGACFAVAACDGRK
jgi:hypothetical protein